MFESIYFEPIYQNINHDIKITPDYTHRTRIKPIDAWLGAAIGAVGSIAGGLLSSKGGSSGSTSSQVTPAPFDEDQLKVWDDFMGQIYGVSSKTFEQTAEEKKEEEQKSLEDAGLEDTNRLIATWTKPDPRPFEKEAAERAAEEKLKEGPIETSSSFLDKLKEDDTFLKETYTKYLSDTDIERQSLIDALSGYQADVGKYQSRGEQARGEISRIGKETLTPVSIGLGDRGSVSFIPGAATRSYSALKQPVLDKRSLDKELLNAALQTLGASEKKYGANLGFLQESLGLAPQMVPNVAAKQYMDFISPIAMQLQALRYGIPSATQKASYQPSLLNTMGTAIDTYSQIKGLLQPTQQQPTQFETVPEVQPFQSQYF